MAVKDSILLSVKKLLGIEPDCGHFDTDVILNVNAAFMTLAQIGAGPEGGFAIEDETAMWTDFLGKSKNLEAVKLYVYLKTKHAFDPPQMGYLVDAIKKQTDELEWRLCALAEERNGDGRKS